jgi:Domain of unknown function (DU1801)
VSASLLRAAPSRRNTSIPRARGHVYLRALRKDPRFRKFFWWLALSEAVLISVPTAACGQRNGMARKASSTTISTFLANLPAERRREVRRVREEIRRYLPAGYEEVISKNMLVYQVPLERYSDTYNGHPLWFVALASEKSYLSLHLMPIYGDKGLVRRLVEGFEAAGRKLDMGKACIHFKTNHDLAFDVIGQIVATIPPDRWVQIAQAARRR